MKPPIDASEQEKENFLIFNSATYSRAIEAFGKTDKARIEAAYALHETNEILVKKISEMESLIPKRIEIEGKQFVYHVPDHLIPLTKP